MTDASNTQAPGLRSHLPSSHHLAYSIACALMIGVVVAIVAGASIGTIAVVLFCGAMMAMMVWMMGSMAVKATRRR